MGAGPGQRQLTARAVAAPDVVQHNGDMVTLARLLLVAVSGVLALLLGTSVAAACSCVEKTTAEHVAEADLVARVIVELVNMPVEGNTDGQPATYTLRPTYVWKGDVVSQFKVASEPNGAACGLEGISEGQDLVVFADETPDGGWSANLCGGTAPASEALVVELRDAAGPGVALDTDPAGKPGSWVWPTVASAAAVLLLWAVIHRWWVRPRRED